MAQLSSDHSDRTHVSDIIEVDSSGEDHVVNKPASLSIQIPPKPSGICVDTAGERKPCAPTAQLVAPSDVRVSWGALYKGKPFHWSSLVPPAVWLPRYIRCVSGRATAADTAAAGKLEFSVKGDVVAGLTVGFMLVPQCLAFALLAGLPVQVGLFASFAPLVVYAVFGTIRQVQPGPTALMSLLTGQALDQAGLMDDESRIAGAVLLALLVGAVSLVLGALRVGFIVDFMSHSVMTAFCTAAGMTIGTSQLKHLFGISMDRKKYWWQTASYLVSHLHETDGPTFALGGTLLFMLLFLKQWKSAGSAETRRQHYLWRFLPREKTSVPFRAMKIIADLSSLLSVVIGWFWGLAYRENGVKSVRLVGDVDGSELHFVLPGDGLPADLDLGGVFVSAAMMAVVGFLETIAVGGKFAAAARYEYDPNQELLALGLSNIAGALMGGYPTTGSFSRTAVNAIFGATSLIACGISAAVVLAAILLILPIIAYLPLAALAPIIIQGAIGVLAFPEFYHVYKVSRGEFLVMLATFAVALGLTVKEGLLVGFALSVLLVMHGIANPNIAVCGRCSDGSFRDVRVHPSAQPINGLVVLRMDARLTFANARKVKEFVTHAVSVLHDQGEQVKCAILDGKAINHIDFTGSEALVALAENLQLQDCRLILANIKGPVSRCLMRAGAPSHLLKHGAVVCTTMHQALTEAGVEEHYADEPESPSVGDLARKWSKAQVAMNGNSRIKMKLKAWS